MSYLALDSNAWQVSVIFVHHVLVGLYAFMRLEINVRLLRFYIIWREVELEIKKIIK